MKLWTLNSAEHETNQRNVSQIVCYSVIDNLYVYCVRTPDEGGTRGALLPQLVLKLLFIMGVFLEICFEVITQDI